MSTETQADIAVAEEVKYEEIKQFNIVVHNNDITSYEEVVFIVSRSFNKTEDEAFAIAKEVDQKGKGICGTFDGEMADAKLVIVDMAKQYLVENYPHRAMQVKELKFTKEEVK